MKMSKSEAGRLGAIVSSKMASDQKSERIRIYDTSPCYCAYTECNTALPYQSRHNKFCNQSCAAKHNNKISPKSVSRKPSLGIISIDPDRPALVTFECRFCGKAKISHRHRPVYYCSAQCQADESRKKKFERVVSGTACSGAVKSYLLNQHGNICFDPECAWDFSKREVKVELDHIDGNSTNNNLENCRLLCPGCHSLTPTYKSKNNGNGRHSRRERYSKGKSY